MQREDHLIACSCVTRTRKVKVMPCMIIERGRLFSYAPGSPRHARLSTEFEASEDANDELDAS
jgi:hypothetical protein